MFLTRAGCPSCDAARAHVVPLAAEYGAELEVVDVDTDANADVRAEYGDLVPVVLIDGVQHSCWGVDPDELRAELDARGRGTHVTSA